MLPYIRPWGVISMPLALMKSAHSRLASSSASTGPDPSLNSEKFVGTIMTSQMHLDWLNNVQVFTVPA